MFPKCDKRRPITFYTLKLSREYFNTLHYLIILRSFVSQQTARYQTFDIFDIRIFFTKYHESGIQFIIYKRIQRGDERYNYSKDRSEPFGHFARGWIYPCAVLTFSLYDSGLRARPSIHTYICIHPHTRTHTLYDMKARKGSRNVRTRHISKSVERSNISRFDDGESKLPQIEMEDERIERIRLDGIEGIRGREQSRKIVADLDIWISTTSWGEVGGGIR